jgi:hypothetical protein
MAHSHRFKETKGRWNKNDSTCLVQAVQDYKNSPGYTGQKIKWESISEKLKEVEIYRNPKQVRFS